MNVMKQAFGEYINLTRIWYRQTDAKLNILQVQSVIIPKVLLPSHARASFVLRPYQQWYIFLSFHMFGVKLILHSPFYRP